jgi:hypothetical protein
MLAGRNVPTKVLTKKMRMSGHSGGRSIVQSRTIHRYAMSDRSTSTSTIAQTIGRQSAPAAAASTSRG